MANGPLVLLPVVVVLRQGLDLRLHLHQMAVLNVLVQKQRQDNATPMHAQVGIYSVSYTHQTMHTKASM